MVDTDRRDAATLLHWCLRRHWRGVAVAAVFGVLTQLLFVAVPWAVQNALDDGLTPGDVDVALLWAAAVLGLGLLLTACWAVGQWQNYLVGARAVILVRQRLLDHLLGLDRRGLAGYGHGDLLTRSSRDADLVWVWVGGVIETVQLALGTVIILGAIALLDWRLAIVGLAVVPLVVVLAVVFPDRYERASLTLGESHGARSDLVEGMVAGGAAVRGIGAESALLRRHGRLSADVSVQTLRVARIGAVWGATASAVPMAATAVGIAVGGFAVIAGELSIGGLVAFTSWMSMLSSRVDGLVGQQVARREAMAGAARIAELLALTPRQVRQGTVMLPAQGVLEADGLRMDVESRPDPDTDEVPAGEGPLFTPVTLRVAPGETVAVTGPTGVGKSTLLRALCGLDDPAAGSVRLGGVDLRLSDPDELRARIAFVPQRPVLVSGTIAENLRLGRDDLDLAALRTACAVAAIDEHISGLPDGYETPVGEKGATLSGGQVQRLALARALLRETPVLVLDDVTSAVDTATEARILDALRAHRPGVAVVVATHRAAVLRSADRVVTVSTTRVTAGVTADAGGHRG